MTQLPLDAQLLTDRLDVIDTVYRFAAAIDTRDWAGYRAVFTDEIDVDYTSYRPGSIARMPADDWVGRATRLFPGLDASQHSISNPRVALDGDRAVLDCYVRADHSLVDPSGDSMFTIGGKYRMEMARLVDGWRINAVALTVLWNQGNRYLMTVAAERAAALLA
jgi:3-phenylpropionate/cinnamic acid dioxygenase small subunit